MEIGASQQFFVRVLAEACFQGYYLHLVLHFTFLALVTRLRFPLLLKTLLGTTFIIGVATFSVDVLVYLKYYDQGDRFYPSELRQPRVVLRVVNSSISQAFVLWRCFQLWPGNRLVLAFNCFLLAGSVGVGIYTVSQLSSDIQKYIDIYIWTLFASTVVLGGIVIYRSLWMKRKAQQYCVGLASYSYSQILVDSGIAFPLLILIDRAIFFHPLQTSFVQIAGITASSIIIQTSLGRNPRTLESVLKDESLGTQSSTPVLDTLFGSMMVPSLQATDINRTSSMVSCIPTVRGGEPVTPTTEEKSGNGQSQTHLTIPRAHLGSS